MEHIAYTLTQISYNKCYVCSSYFRCSREFTLETQFSFISLASVVQSSKRTEENRQTNDILLSHSMRRIKTGTKKFHCEYVATAFYSDIICIFLCLRRSSPPKRTERERERVITSNGVGFLSLLSNHMMTSFLPLSFGIYGITKKKSKWGEPMKNWIHGKKNWEIKT